METFSIERGQLYIMHCLRTALQCKSHLPDICRGHLRIEWGRSCVDRVQFWVD